MAGEIFHATLADARTLSPHVRELTLLPDSGLTLAYAPGQWLSLRLPVGDYPPLIRAYSLLTPPQDDGKLTLCFDRVEGGMGSSYLWDLPVGSPIDFSGPLGNFTLPNTTHDLVFLARYTGIVPFYAMVMALAADPLLATSGRRVHLLYEVSRREELVYHRELAALALRLPWLDYRPCVVDETVEPLAGIGQFMHVLDGLKANAADWMPFVPMVCGVREFTRPVRDYLMESLGFERRAVKVENFNGINNR